jgi:hypothetical protein
MRPPLRLLPLVAALLGSVPPVAVAQIDLAVEQRLLEELLREGKYKQASIEAQRIEQSLKGAAKGGAATRVRIDLLQYRETVERLMGNLDAAEKPLAEAERLFLDKDFQRWIAINAPREQDAAGGFYLPWSLLYFSLLDDRSLLLVDRIRAANQEFAVRDSSLTPERQAQVVKWFKQLDEHVRSLIAARSSSPARIPEDRAAAEGRSPVAHMMLGGTRPRLISGLRHLEASKLPFTLPVDALPGTAPTPPAGDHPVTEPPAERKASASRQRRRAIESLERAVEDAGAACQAALDRFEKERGDSKELVAAEAEAARIRAAVREPLAEALLLDGQPEKARELIDAAVSDLRSVEQDRHPALAKPLITSARVALEETRRSIDAKDVVQAERQAKGAIEALYEAKVLLEVEDSQFDRAGPLHAAVADLIATSDALVRKSGQLVTSKDAADAAARRALDAIRASERKKTPAGAGK